MAIRQVQGFFLQMAAINFAADAQRCLAACMWSSIGIGRCLMSCLSQMSNANLKKLQRYVDGFNECLARGSNNCADQFQDCWCPWM
jgi:hypothetical protein